MAFYYLDASALVKYYILEPGSTWVRELINPLTFVSGDNTLLNAAQAEGLPTDNPFDHISPHDTPEQRPPANSR